jgi:ParB family chromosome partitioning protein
MSETQERDPIFGAGEIKEIVELEVEAIRPDPNQPRKDFNEEKLEELAASIKEHGLLQPISVRKDPSGEGYLIVTGERRYQAHKLLGRARIEAIILRNLDEAGAFEVALIENLQREDLSPFEEAAGYQRLMDEFGYTQEQVSERVGKARSTITNTLALNRLPEKIRAEVAATNRVSKSVLLEVARLEREADQLRMWERIKRHPTTLRGAREEKQGQKVAPIKASEQKKRLIETLKLGSDFARRLEKIDAGYLTANRKDYEKLRGLYERIGTILAALGSAESGDGASNAEAAADA